ncbi:PREDICTED: bidirectional sugar transporter NEC1-like [Ipomoea nil]|uniref:bidirectional sugar transporter NEC1-like n=1 Tax=Ipomoea nil TaxID=35883 RepID=UPI000901A798|nr:PREDICTED: bidirectional sugar transporter NEC1-like [Ipomoea nil]
MANSLANVFGILGNIMSFMVFLSPLPAFHVIYKRKSSEGFQFIPYSVALFSCMLYLYYAYVKKHMFLLVTINSLGMGIQSIYLTIYIVYATKQAKIFTIWVLLIFNVGALGLLVVFTYLFSTGPRRVKIVGWFCCTFSICVFAAPLSIMRKVIRTKSVEYMPFLLSFFLTLCAVVWFFYGVLIHDYYVATPNVLGFALGIAQMILYAIYRKRKTQALPVAALDAKIQDITATEMPPERPTKQEAVTVPAAMHGGRNGSA